MRKLGRFTRSKSYKIHVSLSEGCHGYDNEYNDGRDTCVTHAMVERKSGALQPGVCRRGAASSATAAARVTARRRERTEAA